MDKIFWMDAFEGKAKGGLFIRSDIGKEIKRIEDENGLNIVAIKIDPDGGWNTEFIVEDKPSAEVIPLFPQS